MSTPHTSSGTRPTATSSTSAAPRTATWITRAALGLVTVAATALVPPAPASGATVAYPAVHENGSAALALSSGWSTTRTTTASGGSFSTLVGRSGYASMTFKATGVAWISRPGPYNGIAQIYLDGRLVKTYDGYASKTQYKKTVWSVSGLSDTTHTLKIVRTGTKGSSARGANLVVDALRVLDVTAPSAPTSVEATPVRSGYTLSWARPSAGDLNGYRLYRQAGSGSSTQIAWLPAGTPSFRDVGLADATSYTYRVKAVDQTGNASASSAAVVVKTAAQPSYAAVRYSACPSATTTVSTWKQLQSALGAAKAGTVIRMNPGTYSIPWGMSLEARGTASSPIWVCGPRSAVLNGPGTTKAGGFRVNESSYLRLAGMTVRNSQKGIQVMNSDHVAVSDMLVEHIGEEAVHLKQMTTDSVVIGNTVRDTGLMTAKYGEGVYVGSSKANWCAYNGCRTDASDRNAVVWNTISRTTAEPIDLKEGATNGTVWGNTVDGGGMTSGTSLISVQSNSWVVAKNKGANAKTDAVQVWQVYEVWGKNNTLYANTFTSSVPGYGVRLAYKELGNVVGCDTTVPSGSDGISNKACQK